MDDKPNETEKMSVDKWLASAGFTKVEHESGTYQSFWRSPKGVLVTERVALDVVEGRAADNLRHEFPVSWRRRDDRRFFAGLAMRAIIGRLPVATSSTTAEDHERMRGAAVDDAIAFADAMMAKLGE